MAQEARRSTSVTSSGRIAVHASHSSPSIGRCAAPAVAAAPHVEEGVVDDLAAGAAAAPPWPPCSIMTTTTYFGSSAGA